MFDVRINDEHIPSRVAVSGSTDSICADTCMAIGFIYKNLSKHGEAGEMFRECMELMGKNKDFSDTVFGNAIDLSKNKSGFHFFSCNGEIKEKSEGFDEAKKKFEKESLKADLVDAFRDLLEDLEDLGG